MPTNDKELAPPHPLDEEVSMAAWPMPLRLEYFLTQANPKEWWADQAIETFAYYRENPQTWGHIAAVASEKFISIRRLEAAIQQALSLHEPQDVVLPLTAGDPTSRGAVPPNHAREAIGAFTETWRKHLQCTAKGEPKETMANIMLFLTYHHDWENAFWWDEVRSKAMCRDDPVTDDFTTNLGTWFGITAKMATRSPKLLERAVHALAHATTRDTRQEYLAELPPWDHVERLEHWLCDACELERTPYHMAVSRLVPVSMVARALDPGCLYRYVVILEGPEEIGKSSLVRALAGTQGYVELSMGLDSKEAHMILQGAWIAELAELDSYDRTEETRLKSFISMREDTYIPKYQNDPLSVKRRTIFIGTTNKSVYLKGTTGNTRLLPIHIPGKIDLTILTESREQLLAEAIDYYRRHEADWWRLPEGATEAAKEAREERRMASAYEDPLRQWLDREASDVTCFESIARGFLGIESRERWTWLLQRQISQTMEALGWKHQTVRINGVPVKGYRRH